MPAISVNIQTADNELQKIASVNGSEKEKTAVTLPLDLSPENSPYQINGKICDLMLISNDGDEDASLYIGDSPAFILKAGESFSGLYGINAPVSVGISGNDSIPIRIIYTKESV
ncbi:MAG: hypothetical protein HFH68_00225 [Lachnospiraceae bacterium]|nr:hypothetical protein [Lachnospiraceae bacterium]